MISPVIETHAAVMPRKCARAKILTARFAVALFVRSGWSMGNEI
jgi:hypothetical protein